MDLWGPDRFDLAMVLREAEGLLWDGNGNGGGIGVELRRIMIPIH